MAFLGWWFRSCEDADESVGTYTSHWNSCSCTFQGVLQQLSSNIWLMFVIVLLPQEALAIRAKYGAYFRGVMLYAPISSNHIIDLFKIWPQIDYGPMGLLKCLIEWSLFKILFESYKILCDWCNKMIINATETDNWWCCNSFFVNSMLNLLIFFIIHKKTFIDEPNLCKGL